MRNGSSAFSVELETWRPGLPTISATHGIQDYNCIRSSAQLSRHSARFLMIVFSLVYNWCMTRTNIDIDDEACAIVMRRYRLATKREAVNFALRTLAEEPLGLDEARKLRGAGWNGDLDEMRTHRNQ